MGKRHRAFAAAAAVILVCAARYADADPTGCDLSALTVDDSLSLLFHGHEIGTMVHTVRFDSQARSVVERTCLVVTPPPQVRELSAMTLEEMRTYGLTGDLAHGVQELRGPGGTNRWEVEQLDGRWVVTVDAGGVRSRKVVDNVHESLRATCRLMTGIRNGSIGVGESWTDTVFELVSATAAATVTTCVATAADSGRWIFSVWDGLTGHTGRLELEADGGTRLQEIGQIFVAVRKGLAQPNPGTESISFSDVVKVPAERALRPGEHVRLFLDSTELHGSVRQFYRRAADGGWDLLPLPARCRAGGTVPESLAVYTVATVTMQSGDTAIMRLGRTLRKRDGCATIRAVNDYVYRTLSKRNTLTFSTARETLLSGFGDCGEHAVLAGAILRAARIPARVVYGLFHVPNRQGYCYHAWVEAWASGTWQFADPSWGVFPASVNRVPLIVDDNGEMVMDLARLITRIRISHVQ